MPAFIPRHLVATIESALGSFPAVLVTGARQTGKTTLLRHAFGDRYRYVSLERPDVRDRALADPMGFFRDTPPPVILDEIQHAPILLHWIKDRIDHERAPGQWLLSGSQSLPLMDGVSQTLAGRVAVLTLDPLSCSEARGSARAPAVDDTLAWVFAGEPGLGPRALAVDLGDWLLNGGYPELRARPQVDRRLWFASYVQTYLERDVRDLLQVGDLTAFSRFLALAAARTGCLLNMSDLGRDAGVTGPTVRRWLSVLEASQVIYLLPPYHRNFGKRLTKSPKLYFLDPGLAAFLVGLHDPGAILQGPSAGALFETAVVGEWIKRFRNNGERPSLYFWRASGGLEVDLVIESGGRLWAIEAKSTATPTPRHADSLAKWLELSGTTSRGALACQVEQSMALREGIRAVPWHLATE